MAIYKSPKKGCYAQIDNQVLQDKRLSFKARGLLAHLLSRPSNWNVSIQDLVNQSPGGIGVVRSAMRELETLGYAKLVCGRGADGKITGNQYQIFERPVGHTAEGQENRRMDFPSHGSSVGRKTQTHIKTDFTKTDLQQKQTHQGGESESLFQQFLEVYGCQETQPLQRVWVDIPADQYQLIINHATRYVAAQPERRYRKRPLNYLREEIWREPIIDRSASAKGKSKAPRRDSAAHKDHFNTF